MRYKAYRSYTFDQYRLWPTKHSLKNMAKFNACYFPQTSPKTPRTGKLRINRDQNSLHYVYKFLLISRWFFFVSDFFHNCYISFLNLYLQPPGSFFAVREILIFWHNYLTEQTKISTADTERKTPKRHFFNPAAPGCIVFVGNDLSLSFSQPRLAFFPLVFLKLIKFDSLSHENVWFPKID